MHELRVLELFSGIGGMHQAANLAAQNLNLRLNVIGAIDINTVSNEVYTHNHPSTKLFQRNIAGLSSKELNKLSPEVVLMSPPCQPHTRQGKQLDTEDNRSSALDNLTTILPDVDSIRFVLLENVCGFEKSNARCNFLKSLQSSGFMTQEFLLCPRQIGIPNSRLRYYLIAKRGSGTGWNFEKHAEIHQNFQKLEGCLNKMEIDEKDSESVSKYLDIKTNNTEQFYVPEKVLLKHKNVLDIIRKESLMSCCFTAGYTRYCEGTGSVLQTVGAKEEMDEAYASKDNLEALMGLRLRYFSPTEIARLLGFPEEFSFPESTTLKQKYKSLGNSINVKVVAILIYSLLS